MLVWAADRNLLEFVKFDSARQRETGGIDLLEAHILRLPRAERQALIRKFAQQLAQARLLSGDPQALSARR